MCTCVLHASWYDTVDCDVFFKYVDCLWCHLMCITDWIVTRYDTVESLWCHLTLGNYVMWYDTVNWMWYYILYCKLTFYSLTPVHIFEFYLILFCYTNVLHCGWDMTPHIAALITTSLSNILFALFRRKLECTTNIIPCIHMDMLKFGGKKIALSQFK